MQAFYIRWNLCLILFAYLYEINDYNLYHCVDINDYDYLIRCKGFRLVLNLKLTNLNSYSCAGGVFAGFYLFLRSHAGTVVKHGHR